MILEIGTLGLGVGAVHMFQLKEKYHSERIADATKLKGSEKRRLEYAAFHYAEWWKAMCYRKGAAIVATAGAVGTTWRTLQLVGIFH